MSVDILETVTPLTPLQVKSWSDNLDELVKSRKTPFFVIPAKAGIQFFQLVTEFLDSDFHRSDDFLRDRQP